MGFVCIPRCPCNTSMPNISSWWGKPHPTTGRQIAPSRAKFVGAVRTKSVTARTIAPQARTRCRYQIPRAGRLRRHTPYVCKPLPLWGGGGVGDTCIPRGPCNTSTLSISSWWGKPHPTTGQQIAPSRAKPVGAVRTKSGWCPKMYADKRRANKKQRTHGIFEVWKLKIPFAVPVAVGRI